MRIVVTSTAVAVWGLVVFFALGLARWQYMGDPPLLNYAGWLMVEHGAMPYRDFFETSMPGTFLIHAALVKLGLHTDLPFLVIGMSMLIGLGLIGANALHRIGQRWGVVFALSYLTLMLLIGPGALMQRELVGTTIIAIAALVAMQAPRMFWIGLLFGFACMFKPQLAFTAPIVVLASSIVHRRPVVESIIVSLLGFSLPLIAAFLWLWMNDALDGFLFLAREYLPLHIQQTTFHVFLPPLDRIKYVIKGAVTFGGFWPLFIGTGLLAVLQFVQRQHLTRNQHITLVGLSVMSLSYSLIPIIAGQFWNYHYFPFIFFGTLSTSACLLFAQSKFPGVIRKTAMAGAIGIPLLQAGLLYDPQMVNKIERNMKIIGDMETALNKWRPPGGTVQPIDWTKGALHAMLRNRAPIATPFLYDYHFRHHISRAEIQTLRDRFMSALTENRPDIILEVPTRPRAKGLDTSYDWPELDRFISENYQIVDAQENHIIHLKITP